MKKSKLKKRLRKKFRVGEFQEFGFRLFVKFRSNFTEAAAGRFWYEFINEIERNKLLYGGGSSVESLHGFVTSSKLYQSPTTAQREKIKSWVESRAEIADSEVGNLVDAWYDIN